MTPAAASAHTHTNCLDARALHAASTRRAAVCLMCCCTASPTARFPGKKHQRAPQVRPTWLEPCLASCRSCRAHRHAAAAVPRAHVAVCWARHTPRDAVAACCWCRCCCWWSLHVVWPHGGAAGAVRHVSACASTHPSTQTRCYQDDKLLPQQLPEGMCPVLVMCKGGSSDLHEARSTPPHTPGCGTCP